MPPVCETSGVNQYRGVTRIIVAKGRKECVLALMPLARELGGDVVIYLRDSSGKLSVTHKSAYVRIVDPDN